MLDLFLKTTTRPALIPTTTSSNSNFFSYLDGAAAGIIILTVFIALIVLAVAILMIVANCKIFSKAGEKWWKALIPVYNSWVQTRVAGLAWYWFAIWVVLGALLLEYSDNFIISMMLTLVSFNYCYGIAKKFGKSNGFAFLMAILPVIGLPILAFGSAKYDEKAEMDKNGIFAVKK